MPGKGGKGKEVKEMVLLTPSIAPASVEKGMTRGAARVFEAGELSESL